MISFHAINRSCYGRSATHGISKRLPLLRCLYEKKCASVCSRRSRTVTHSWHHHVEYVTLTEAARTREYSVGWINGYTGIDSDSNSLGFQRAIAMVHRHVKSFARSCTEQAEGHTEQPPRFEHYKHSSRMVHRA